MSRNLPVVVASLALVAGALALALTCAEPSGQTRAADS
jgi:hypothetical protein